jgi:hypothetical protein
MTYYIFLKSLRSLEEFRKNPHVKIPPKSPFTNFQSLSKFKNPIFYSKRIFPQNLAHPAQPRPCWPAPQRRPPHARSAHPGLRGLGVFTKRRLFFEFAQPGDDAFFLCHSHAGPACQLRRLPHVGRPEARLPRASPQLIAPRLPASIIATPIKVPYSPALIPPLEAPLTPSPAINGVGHKSPAVTHRHFLPGAPPTPIKGEHHPRVAPHLSPASFPSLHA